MFRRSRIIVTFLLAALVIAAAWGYVAYRGMNFTSAPVGTDTGSPDAAENPVSPSTHSGAEPAEGPSTNVDMTPSPGVFVAPLSRASDRVTKKPFGIFITRATSPVQPERFSGYHTGTDFEIFPEEADAEVTVSAICTGKLILKRAASGYGGIAVQSCDHDGRPVSVVYGHLRLTSVASSVGDIISAGNSIGVLGKGYSTETDGERKHLHLGIHAGKGADIHGYVSSKRELSAWIDPCMLVCHS